MHNTASFASKGIMNLSQLVYGMRPMARAPITTPEVGVTKLVKPAPHWNAVTSIARETLRGG
jgi:hypothetical protein